MACRKGRACLLRSPRRLPFFRSISPGCRGEFRAVFARRVFMRFPGFVCTSKCLRDDLLGASPSLFTSNSASLLVEALGQAVFGPWDMPKLRNVRAPQSDPLC